MKKYVVTGAQVKFISGELGLSDEQYEARQHALEPLEKGAYKVLSVVCFKRGEIVSWDGETSKTQLLSLQEGKRKRSPNKVKDVDNEDVEDEDEDEETEAEEGDM